MFAPFLQIFVKDDFCGLFLPHWLGLDSPRTISPGQSYSTYSQKNAIEMSSNSNHWPQFWTLVSLRNRTAGRRGRQIPCAWRTWQGQYLRVLLRTSLSSMFSGLLQKDLYKKFESEVWRNVISNNYCHACHIRFTVFFSLPSCCISSLLTAKDCKRICRRA